MQFTIPPDLEALVQKRLAGGAYANAEDVIRHALEAQEAEERWTRKNATPSRPTLRKVSCKPSEAS